MDDHYSDTNKVFLVSVLGMCSWYPEEIVEGEDVEVSLILHVQKFKNILQRCWLLPVLQRQNEV